MTVLNTLDHDLILLCFCVFSVIEREEIYRKCEFLNSVWVCNMDVLLVLGLVGSWNHSLEADTVESQCSCLVM